MKKSLKRIETAKVKFFHLKFSLLKFFRRSDLLCKQNLFLLGFACLIQLVNAQNDKFADIGTQVYSLRADLVVPQPINLPDISLPITNNKKTAFKAVSPISTKEELSKLLIQARAKYAPFMLNVAPALPEQRQRLALKDFNWRISTAADSVNLMGLLKGDGKWEKVNIPHFGPPLGRATTYYFKELEISQELLSSEALFICFKGVDYKATVFVNGNYCGFHEGFFAPFEFNISHLSKTGKNTILIKVENDVPTSPGKDAKGNVVNGDKIYAATGPGYDDPILGWHHGPAGMGIYQDCYIESRSNIHINDLYVRPKVEKSVAEAWVEINNFEEYPSEVKLKISVYGQNFKDTIIQDFEYIPSTTMIPGVGDLVKPTDNQFRILKMGYGVNYLRIPLEMKNFRYWDNETPWLYQLQVKVYNKDNRLLDSQFRQFGMRSFTMDTLSVPKGNMFLNGKPIRLRGANTMGHEQQCVMRGDWDQLRDDILLAKLCNMNFLRFTQRPVQQEIYDYCDQLGLMNQADLPLFGSIRRNKVAEAVKQVEEMERLVRSHPSTIMVSYINERFPNAEGNPQRSLSSADEYFKMFKALDQMVLLSNPDRVIKAGDGDYDPPTPGLPDSHCYNTWYNGHGLGLGKMYKGYWQPVKPDWYYACGEFGAEGLDPLNVMHKYYPKEWLPKNAADEKNWNANRISMSQTHRFHYMWYNTQHSLEDWINASQEYQATAMKFVAESFRRDSRMVSFAIHLFIDAWPAGWMKTIMDVDRQPKKAYFAYRNALEPLMVSIRSDRKGFFSGETAAFEAWICNDLNTAPINYQLHYQVERGGRVVFSNSTQADIAENEPTFQGYIPYVIPIENKRTAYKLRIALMDEKGKSIAQNEFDFDVFPTPVQNSPKVFCLSGHKGLANTIAKQAHLQLVPNMENADVILMDDFGAYKANENAVNKLVSAGKKAIFLELRANEYTIADTKVAIEKTSMGDYYFVSPTTGHVLVTDFKPFDFNMWYNEKEEVIMPLLSYTMSAPAWTTILSSGATNWVTDKGQVMAAGELKYGKGIFRICEIKLNDRLNTNPTALIFLNNLIQ